MDPELDEELRVTVVVTGISSTIEKEMAKPKLVPKPSPATGKIDYSEMDTPTVIRQEQRKKIANGGFANAGSGSDMEYLDIPAFLRRQAD